MAAVQHPRTRSARLVAGFTNKSAQHAPSPAPQVHHGPPALSIFLTNLNLLDLDQHEDWPDIRAETFATGGSSAQGLKKRVQCVEWALFHLFALWDPEETKKKLKPFFPPIDQSQSVNLRAALLRALDQAKKNGVLGRDAVIRKTMLDECRGERLEEVLAAFSSAVLKHVIAQEVSTSGHTALALGLALEDRGYKSDNTDLNTMVLAHKVAISRILNSKVAASSRFHDFSDLLTVKEKGIARRKEALQALEGGKTISEDARREMWRTLRNNWSGNERWMETLLYGDASAKKDGLLGMPFDRVWRRVQQGRLDELEEHSSGLLEQLDTRVRVQKERLQKWQSFRNELSVDQPRPSPSKVKQRQKENGIDFGFGAHEALQLGRVSPKKTTFGKQKLIGEYDDLVSTLEQELQSTKPQKSSALDFLQRPFSNNPPSINVPAPEPEQEEEVISELEDEDGLPESPIKSFKSKLDLSKRFPVRPKLAHTGDSFASVSSSTRSLRKPSEDEARILRASSVERTSSPEPEDEPVAASPRPEYDVSPQLTPQLSPQPSPPPSPLPLQESPELMPAEPPGTQEMADQILESMNMASPSPVKRSRPRPRHTLSLAERTRLTMTRESFGFPDNEVLDLSPPTSAEPVSAEDPTQSVDEEFDLIARTKKSMAGFDKARKKAQMERRRSLRKPKAPTKKEDDYFPKVDEEETTICTDELMAQEDMEAVFRSRPKIKASPLPSPTRDWSDDEYM
ncbi:HAUS augmin-like complex subunit 6 N-terminus-domain-containing protein [Fusarium tricinctum]|uniref:HAUS augmin-like complex subunit 6 N-terminus-domain-containing protein n=1 Tax=Fusarium tricinctum TaxID=61284 RepID=A0A8K0RZN0_9HYPO|nr:HAUS augmin-like complex subunit 6 N-terminus-domain-containing protein [Fusarium tricinctum]